MAITDPYEWKKSESRREQDGRALQTQEDSVLTFEQLINRLFDDFFLGSGLELLSAFSPPMDVVETDKGFQIAAELPGLERKDIDVALSRKVLTISGEKREAVETKGRNYLRTERSYGSFRRSIPLPSEVDASKAEALFRNGVLTVTIPRTAKAEAGKRITIKAK